MLPAHSSAERLISIPMGNLVNKDMPSNIGKKRQEIGIILYIFFRSFGNNPTTDIHLKASK